MGQKSDIEWTDATWNPVAGCSPVSPGCANCYAARLAHRFNTPSPKSPYHGLTRLHTNQDGKRSVLWTGDVRVADSQLHTPFGWSKPRRVFVCSMGDLFHENVTNEFIAHVFAVMALSGQHTFQVLTKRAARMREWFQWVEEQATVSKRDQPQSSTWRLLVLQRHVLPGGDPRDRGWRSHLSAGWPLQNVWLGVSAENQAKADERVPLLLRCPAATRFVSCEPLLEKVDLTSVSGLNALAREDGHHEPLDWVIAGGESGPGARPMNLDWARDLRDQCQKFSTPYFFKQVGGAQKKRNGRELDGRTWEETP